MKDIFWTCYLASTLYVSFMAVLDSITANIMIGIGIEMKNPFAGDIKYKATTACIMWAIWYMYFLH